ncbi:MAG: hypothetical protein SVV80_03160 [Planctomycetota bacterium]|nr:hypothetical protein [Planctomycetota bacterium]
MDKLRLFPQTCTAVFGHFRAVCTKVVVIFVGEDKPGKDGEAGNALALSMEPDEASRSRNQEMATRFMKSALNHRFIGRLCENALLSLWHPICRLVGHEEIE